MLLAIALSAAAQATVTPIPNPVSPELTAMVSAIARAWAPDVRVVVRVPSRWRHFGKVDAKTWKMGQHIAIYISPILVEELDADAMLGILAHELAHTQNRCGPQYRSDEEHAACERDADALAARWVGKRTVIRGLCQVMAVSWDWRYTTNAAPMIDRIRALHHRRDIR